MSNKTLEDNDYRCRGNRASALVLAKKLKLPTAILQLPEEFAACPDEVRAAIELVASEATTKSIWFIGSRANARARPESDWDVLVFSTDEVRQVGSRVTGLDVLRVSPAGDVLLEGMTEHFIQPFSRFRWSQIDKDHASYEGHRFRDSDSPRDFSESPVEVSQCRAFLIYEKEANQRPEATPLRVVPQP